MPKIEINDTNIHYDVTGNGYPLVLIHGGGLESSSWHSQISFFSKRYRVITFDLRGHGRSELPEESYSIGDCAEDLHKLLEHLAIKQTYIVGSSMGGNIALNFTISYPEMVDALIISGTNSAPMVEWVMEVAKEDMVRIRSKGSYSAMKVAKALEANILRPDLTDKLSDIKMPVLIIVGEQDRHAPPYVAERMQRRIANSQMVVLSDCGHICNQDQPDIFNSTVSNFLQIAKSV